MKATTTKRETYNFTRMYQSKSLHMVAMQITKNSANASTNGIGKETLPSHLKQTTKTQDAQSISFLI